MQHDAADQLHIEMPHPQRPSTSFAHRRKRRNNRRLDRFLQLLLDVRVVVLNALEPRLHLGFQLRRVRRQLRVRKLLHRGLERIDLAHHRLNHLDVALVLRPDKSRDDAINYSLDVHISLVRCL